MPISTTNEPSTNLKQAAELCGITGIADDRLEVLESYCQLLWEWNEKINLTRHTDYERFVARDVVDTLQLAKLILPDEEVIDIGSGYITNFETKQRPPQYKDHN